MNAVFDMTKKALRPPSHLQSSTRQWWLQVVQSYQLEPHHIRLLTTACESWDRAQAARQVLEREGLVYYDRFKAPRLRPEVSVERDHKALFMRAVRELALDGLEPPEAARPPLIPGRYLQRA